MKQVAFFVTSLDSGGIENYLLRFLRFSAGEFHPIVICKSGRLGELESKYRELPDIKIISLKLGYLDVFAHRELYQILKKSRVSSVCDFTGNFAGAVLFLSSFLKVETRIAFYRGAAIRFKPTVPKMLYNQLMRILVRKYSTKILSNSKAALDVFYPNRNKSDSRYKVIYNGVNKVSFIIDKSKVRQRLSLPKNAFIVGHVGRNDESKNLPLIGEVAKIICQRYSDIYFVLCGKNTESYVDKVTAVYPELTNRLIALGYRDDIENVLAAYDVFIFPSIIEGQPNALIEALIAGLPVVASDIPPVVETLPPNKRWFLNNPNNVSGFADLIERCYKDESIREKLTAREWAVKQYNPDILFNKFLTELL